MSEIEKRNRKITWLAQWLPETSQGISNIIRVSQAMYFYSLPYEKREGLTIHLMGAAKKEHIHKIPSLSHKRPLVYVNGEKAQLGGGTGMINKEDQESGILYFLITVECNPEIEINEIHDINVEFKKKDEDGTIFKQNIKIDKLDKEILAPLERYDDLRLKPSNIEQLKKK